MKYKALIVLLLLLATAWNAWGQEQGTETESDAQEQEDDEPRVRRLRDALAVDPDAEWVPTLDAGDLQREIDRKLTLGDRALNAGDLTEPPQGSALYFFNEVLKLDPGNTQAEQGLGRVADELVRQLREAQEGGDRERAMELLSLVKSFRPNYPGLRTLEDQISRREEIEQLLGQAEEYFSASRLVEPESENALATFRAVLAIDARNAQALEGLRRVETALLARAQAAINDNDFRRADRMISLAADIRDDSEAVDAAREALTSARETAWQAQLQDIGDAVEAGNLEAAEAGISALIDSGYQPGEEIARIEAEIANIRRLRQYPAGSTFQDELQSGGQGPVMTVVPNGEFRIGSGSRERDRSDNEGPQQTIVFKVPFALAQSEITVGDFAAFVNATGYVTDAERAGQSTIYNVLAGSLKTEPGISWRRDFQGREAEEDHPVVHVSWNDAKAYVDWLAEETGQPYRLPSEAEFEYALRAGTETPYWWGRGSPSDEVENLTGERDKMAGRWEWPNPFDRYGDDHWGPAPAASFQPNPFGLYDMGGNVLEWVADCYNASHEGIPTDGSARTGGNCNLRVLKGGGWALPPAMSRSASRSSAQTERATCLVGFRVARDL